MISEADCTTELQRVAKKLGHTPTQREFIEHASISVSSVCRLSGWNEALEAAGFNIDHDPILLSIANRPDPNPRHESAPPKGAVPLEDVESVAKLGIRHAIFPSGENIRQTILKHGLETEAKFDAFKQFHPELGYPCATTVMTMFWQHGWAWRVKKANVQYWVALAPSLAENGVVPCGHELRKRGFYGLALAIQKHPELFKGLHMEKRGKSPEEWVPVAEKVAKENGGVLPRRGWLQKHKYSALARVVTLKPDLFRHIPQEFFRKMEIEEHVATAKKLAQQYGRVPPCIWLQEHGYQKLYHAKMKCPEAFKGITFGQNKLIDDVKLAERVETAKKVAQENGGALPTINWLGRHGHHKVVKALSMFPDAFKDIPRKRGSQSHPVEHWVKVAEELARKNQGRIPTHKWLESHGYNGLRRPLTVHPGRFKHLEREQIKQRTPEEWLEIAKQIAPNGILPPDRELKRMGYTGLWSARSKHPELFKDFQANRYRSPSEEKSVRSILQDMKNIPGSITNMLPDVLIKALFDLLGRAAPSLISEVKETESSVRLTKKRGNGFGRALKAVENIIDLSNGQKSKVIMQGVMNTIDRMHTNRNTAYRTAVLKSRCRFAQTMARQYLKEAQRANEIIDSVPGMRYEQALLTVKLERPEGWYS
jgi:hypothetical protein